MCVCASRCARAQDRKAHSRCAKLELGVFVCCRRDREQSSKSTKCTSENKSQTWKTCTNEKKQKKYKLSWINNQGNLVLLEVSLHFCTLAHTHTHMHTGAHVTKQCVYHTYALTRCRVHTQPCMHMKYSICNDIDSIFFFRCIGDNYTHAMREPERKSEYQQKWKFTMYICDRLRCCDL